MILAAWVRGWWERVTGPAELGRLGSPFGDQPGNTSFLAWEREEGWAGFISTQVLEGVEGASALSPGPGKWVHGEARGAAVVKGRVWRAWWTF